MTSLFDDVPSHLSSEIFEDLVNAKGVRVERILSYGHTSPEKGWYDQEENEWVLVLEGYGVLEFEDGRRIKLKAGDYLNIEPHEKHKVVETSSNTVTVWLAIFYQ